MENDRPNNIPGKSLDAMSTANLEELLQAELDSDREIDVEKLKRTLAAADVRTEQKDVDVDAAWDRLYHDHLPSVPIIMPEDTSARKRSSRNKRWVRAGLIAVLAAVLCLGVGLTASAAGYNILDAVMQWSSETFGFSFIQNSSTSSYVSDPEYAQLKFALADAGVTAPLVPNYLPDGYTQGELYASDGQYTAVYQSESNVIVLQIQKALSKDNVQHEKDGAEPEIYTVSGVDHYISTNMGAFIAVWTNDGYECFISGVPTKQELLDMIDSIYLEDSK